MISVVQYQREVHRRHHSGQPKDCKQTTCQIPNDIPWIAERVHQAHHGESGTWRTCGRALCTLAAMDAHNGVKAENLEAQRKPAKASMV